MSESRELAQIGVTGLAVMGRNLARNLARHGYRVAVHNRTYERTRSLVAEHGHEGAFIPSESVKDFVASLGRPRAIIIMVKAGQPTDAEARQAQVQDCLAGFVGQYRRARPSSSLVSRCPSWGS